MRVFILILVLIFSLQSWTNADDVRDFEIEGMSIGNSLLDFYTQEEIDSNKNYYPNSKKFFRSILPAKTDNFERVQVHIKENDQNYTIHAVSGLIFFMDKKNSKNDCLKMHEEIKKEISSMLKNIKPTKQEKKIIEHDETGNSVHYPIYYDFNDSGTEYVKLDCVIYGKEYFEKHRFFDHLRLAFQDEEYSNWLQNEAY